MQIHSEYLVYECLDWDMLAMALILLLISMHRHKLSLLFLKENYYAL